ADSGCELVIHETDTQRSVAFIDTRLHGQGSHGVPLWSMAVDIVDGCRIDADPSQPWLPSCLRVLYWNWSALYTTLFDAMPAGTGHPDNVIEPLHADPRTSPFYFGLNVGSAVSTATLQSTIVDVAGQDYRAIYSGPYLVTGQRDRNGTGTP